MLRPPLESADFYVAVDTNRIPFQDNLLVYEREAYLPTRSGEAAGKWPFAAGLAQSWPHQTLRRKDFGSTAGSSPTVTTVQ